MGRQKAETKTVPDGNMEVIEQQIVVIAKDYIDKYLDGDDSKIKDHFRHLLYYISKNISYDMTKINNMDYLINLFSSYEMLCDYYNIIPSYGMFLQTFKLSDNEIKYALNSKYIVLIQFIKEHCRYKLIDYLSNNKGSDRNLQFIASSVYGMTEIAPRKATEQTIALTNKEIAAQIGVID